MIIIQHISVGDSTLTFYADYAVTIQSTEPKEKWHEHDPRRKGFIEERSEPSIVIYSGETCVMMNFLQEALRKIFTV